MTRMHVHTHTLTVQILGIGFNFQSGKRVPVADSSVKRTIQSGFQ